MTEGPLCCRGGSGGSIVAWGENKAGQCDVPVGYGFLMIVGGGSHSAGVAFAVPNPTSMPGDSSPPRSAWRLETQPNPFNPRTTIVYGMGEPCPAQLTVVELSGRLVRIMLDEPRPAGTHEVRWEGTDERGQPLPSGVYICR